MKTYIVKIKDAKHSFDEINRYITYNAPTPDLDPEKIEAFQKGGHDYIRVVTDNVELTFAVNYDENSKIENLSMLDLTRKNLDTGKIDHPELGNTPLSKIFGLLTIDNNDTYKQCMTEFVALSNQFSKSLRDMRALITKIENNQLFEVESIEDIWSDLAEEAKDQGHKRNDAAIIEWFKDHVKIK